MVHFQLTSLNYNWSIEKKMCRVQFFKYSDQREILFSRREHFLDDKAKMQLIRNGTVKERKK